MEHHLSLPNAFGRWILTHRLWVVVLVGVITLGAALAARRATIRTSLLQGFMPDQSQFEAYRARADLFGGSSDDLLYFGLQEGSSLFTAETFQAIRAAARQLRSFPEILRVTSLADVPRLKGPDADQQRALPQRLSANPLLQLRELLKQSGDSHAGGLLSVPNYWPEDAKSQQAVDFADLRRAMLEDDLVAGTLLSWNGQAHALVVQLAPTAQLEGRAQVDLRRRIEATLREHGLGAQGLYAAGVLVTQGWMLWEAVRSIILLFPLGAVVICLLVYRIFGRLRLVIVTLSISTVATIWAFGATALVFGEITILVAASPLLILVISTADTIHLATAFATEMEHGMTRTEALEKVIREVGGACILTSLTTFAGFLSLMVVPAATVRHLSLAIAVGVAGALLLAVTLVPISLSLLKLPQIYTTPPSRRGVADRVIRAIVAACKRMSLRHPRLVVGIHAVLLVVATAASFRIQLDADFPNRFPKKHPLRESVAFFNENFVGVNTIEVLVANPSGRVLDPDILTGIAQFEQQAARLPEVKSVRSLLTLMRAADRVLRPRGTSQLPQSEQEARSYLALIALANKPAVQSLVAADQNLTRILVQVGPSRIFQMLDLSNSLERVARQSLPPDADVEISGTYPIIGRAAETVVNSQFQGFGICFLCVMILVFVGLRSCRLSFLAVFPNLLPLVLLGGVLGCYTQPIDSDILGVAVISFGLAIDDTIHFLHRYDIELAGGSDVPGALARTFDYTGQAIVRTTVILGLGLLPFALSEYLSLWFLGTYLVLVLGCAVLADLLLLPALVLLFSVAPRARTA